MTCANCRAKLPEHLETARLDVSRHLRECAACRAEYDTLRHALHLLAHDPCPPAPSLRPGLWAKIEAAATVPAQAVWERPLALALAALLAGCVGRWLWAGWPLAASWLTFLDGLPTPADLTALLHTGLGAAAAQLRAAAAGSVEQYRGLRLAGPAAGPLPVAAWLALVAACGWLVVEWTARRETGRLAPETEGVR